MNYNLEIQKILIKVESIGNYDDKITLLKQAINIADANNDIDWGFDLRLDLIREETYTSHCTESFPAFVWILNVHDNNEGVFEESDFLWEYKWMATSSKRNVNISRDQIESIMEDLRQRMEKNGYTDRAYFTVCMYWHLFLGEVEKAKEYIKLRDETGRDRMSHCKACELDASVEMELVDGEFDKAITLAHDLITKKITCGHMPFGTFCNLAYYLNKAGDERAAEYFVKAEEEMLEMENDTSLLSDIALLMNYLIDNNKERAWEYFEKYAGWEIGAEDSFSFDFTLPLIRLLKQEGVRELALDPKLPYFKADGIYNIGELYDFYYKKADVLANLFDKRNGNDYFRSRLNSVL